MRIYCDPTGAVITPSGDPAPWKSLTAPNVKEPSPCIVNLLLEVRLPTGVVQNCKSVGLLVLFQLVGTAATIIADDDETEPKLL